MYAPMLDIAKYHRSLDEKRPLARFFSTTGFSSVVDYLQEEQELTYNDIIKQRRAHRGSPGVAMVHPLVALEYLRWAGYDHYAQVVLKNVTLHEQFDNT